MSRAFVKEQDGAELEDLPDRLISEHPNLVTPQGLEQIKAEVERLTQAHAHARGSDDRGQIASTARDLRYWTARLRSAEVVEPRPGSAQVHFGSRVTVERGDGRRQAFRIVGEDEANPSKGSIPYVAPLARALSGKEEGDVVRVGADEVEILAIE